MRCSSSTTRTLMALDPPALAAAGSRSSPARFMNETTKADPAPAANPAAKEECGGVERHGADGAHGHQAEQQGAGHHDGRHGRNHRVSTPVL